MTANAINQQQEEYARTFTSLRTELAPEGILEETFADEIAAATWRLRRFRLIEDSFCKNENLNLDPAVDEQTEKQQKSVDRARAQSHLILRRSIAELKKLQTQRAILSNLDACDIPPLADCKQAISTIKLDQSDNSQSTSRSSREMSMADFEALLGLSDAQLRIPANPMPAPAPAPVPASSFCKPATPAPAGQPNVASRARLNLKSPARNLFPASNLTR